MEVLVESWRKRQSLLYSKLDFLLAPPTFEKTDRSTVDQNPIYSFIFKRPNKDPPPSNSKKLSRLKVLKTKHSESAIPLARFKPMNQSAAEAGGFSKVNSLACFLDTMSFIDSHLSRQPCCRSGPLGAKIADGLLDEPREDDDAEMRGHSLERCYEILAVVEGLGFHRSRMEVYPRKQDQDVTRGDKNKTWNLRFGLNLCKI